MHIFKNTLLFEDSFQFTTKKRELYFCVPDLAGSAIVGVLSNVVNTTDFVALTDIPDSI